MPKRLEDKPNHEYNFFDKLRKPLPEAVVAAMEIMYSNVAQSLARLARKSPPEPPSTQPPPEAPPDSQ